MSGTGVIGKIQVNIVANIKKFADGLNTLRGKLKSFVKRVKDGASSLLNFQNAMLGLVGIGGLTALANQVLGLNDALAKTSAKLGIAATELGFLQFAGELSGFGIDQLNTSLQRMTRRVNEAAHGTGEAVNALAELNLDAAQLTKLAPDKQFLLIGQAIQRFPQPDKIRLAMKLFDSEGVGAVNLFGSNLSAARSEFERLGGAVTNEQLAKIETFNDEMFKIGFGLRNFARDVMMQFLPAISEFIDKISNGISGMEKQLATGRIGKVFGGLELVAEGAAGLVDLSTPLGEAFAANSALMGGNFRRRNQMSQLRQRQADLQSRGVNSGPSKEMIDEQRRTRLVFENYLRKQEGRPPIELKDSGL